MVTTEEASFLAGVSQDAILDLMASGRITGDNSIAGQHAGFPLIRTSELVRSGLLSPNAPSHEPFLKPASSRHSWNASRTSSNLEPSRMLPLQTSPRPRALARLVTGVSFMLVAGVITPPVVALTARVIHVPATGSAKQVAVTRSCNRAGHPKKPRCQSSPSPSISPSASPPSSPSTSSSPTASRSPSTSPSTSPPASPSPIGGVAVPSSITSDGSRDATANLQAFVDSVADNSTIVFPAGAVYRIDGMLLFRSRWGLTFDGNGATLERVNAGLSGTDDALFTREVRFMGGGNLTIRNLSVVGANPNAGMSNSAFDPAYEFQHGIELDGVQGALLDHVRIQDVYGDFVYLGMSQSQGVQTPSRNVTIQNSRFERNGRMGISVDYAEDTIIQNNYMGDCRRSWVDVEPTGATWQVRGLTIRNNTVGPHRLNFFANAGRGDKVGDIVISGNRTAPRVAFGAITISRGDSPLALGGYRGPYLIAGNVGPTRAGFSFREAAGITIRNNDIPFPKDVVVQLNDAHTIQVHDNNFTGATGIFQVNDPAPGLSYGYSAWKNKL